MSNKTILNADGIPIRSRPKDIKLNLPFEERYHKLSLWQRATLWCQAVWAGASMRPPTHIRLFYNKDGTEAKGIRPELCYGEKTEKKA